MLITDDGTIIRTSVSEIPVYGRTASGVIVMRLSDNSRIVNFSKVQKEEEEDEEVLSDETESTEGSENTENTESTESQDNA